MKPAGRAREAAVGHERHRIAQAGAHQRARHAEHLAHAGPAARPLVPDDDDVAGLNRLLLHGRRTRRPRCRTPAPARDARARFAPDTLITEPSGARLP